MTGEEIDAMTGNQAREALSVFVRQFAEYRVAAEDTVAALNQVIEDNKASWHPDEVAKINDAAERHFRDKYQGPLIDTRMALVVSSKRNSDLHLKNEQLEAQLKAEKQKTKSLPKRRTAPKKPAARAHLQIKRNCKSNVHSVATHLL